MTEKAWRVTFKSTIDGGVRVEDVHSESLVQSMVETLGERLIYLQIRHDDRWVDDARTPKVSSGVGHGRIHGDSRRTPRNW